MKTNPVKAKLRGGKPSFGTWLSLGDLHATRVLARSGFDWLTLDLEHSAIDWSRAAMIFAAVADAGCVPLARVPEGDHYCIKRVLDGARGGRRPMVDTVEQGRWRLPRQVSARWKPQRRRRHALAQLRRTAGDYYQRANDEILVVLQTESPAGVDNAEAIYSLPGCDAIFVGPNDLRFQMRAADGTMPTAEAHEAMIQRVIAAGKKVGTPTGIHAMDPNSALERAAEGMQFIAVASDLRMLTEGAQRIVQTLWPGGSPRDLARY